MTPEEKAEELYPTMRFNLTHPHKVDMNAPKRRAFLEGCKFSVDGIRGQIYKDLDEGSVAEVAVLNGFGSSHERDEDVIGLTLGEVYKIIEGYEQYPKYEYDKEGNLIGIINRATKSDSYKLPPAPENSPKVTVINKAEPSGGKEEGFGKLTLVAGKKEHANSGTGGNVTLISQKEEFELDLSWCPVSEESHHYVKHSSYWQKCEYCGTLKPIAP